MKHKFIEAFVSIAVLGTVGLFIYQNHQRDFSRSPSYEGNNEVAIARPISESKSLKCQLTKVADGDTITVQCDGQKLKIRFCGIDAPEKSQPLGAESTKLMSELVNKDNGNLLVYPIEKDRYGRTVAEVEIFSGKKTDRGDRINLFVNGEMVRAGLAYHYKQYSGNCPNKDVITYAEDDAKDKKLGVWSGNYEKPWDYRKHNKK